MSIDDYLDLLNYAKAIKDLEWQAEIIETLKNYKIDPEDHLEQNRTAIELWAQFEAINELIKETLYKLGEHENAEEQQEWIEQLWSLKKERNIVSKKILNRYIKIL